MSILITGATGFVGRALIPRLTEKDKHIIALARDAEKAKSLLPAEVEILEGDILKPDLGVKTAPGDIDTCYHLAAIHRLGENKAEEIWETNVGGTANVIEFCKKYEIPRLAFVSSAYTFARNSYEKSKMVCESLVLNSGIPKVTIFKPSIIMGTKDHFYPGHFVQAVLLMIKIHKRAETIRRYIEGKIRLPILRPVFRIPGNPGGKLNLICIEDVAKAITEIEKEGTYWLTNPAPPLLGEIAEWLSEIVLLDLKFEPKFDPTPIEKGFQSLGNAFLPYLWGDPLHCDLKKATSIDKKFIHQNIIQGLISLEI